MKTMRWILAAVGLAIVLPAHAAEKSMTSFAVTSAKKIIYRVTGVTDSGDNANTGVATSFICSNISGTAETLAFTIHQGNGSTVAFKQYTVNSGHTFTFSTHNTLLFDENMYLPAGTKILQGKAIISATTENMHCTAMIVDASASIPYFGVSLHMVRFNPILGSVE